MRPLKPDASLGFWQRLERWLHRPSTGDAFLPVVDGWRCVAILSVVLYHLNDYLVTKTHRQGEADWLSQLLSQGYLGVPLFFALSGFIIARPFLAGTAPGVRRYFMRRLRRLEPPYLINLILIYLLLVIVLGQDAGELLPHLLASAAYLHHVIFGGASKVNFVAWSLEVEFQFYVLAPLLFAALGPWGAWPRRMALILLVLLGGWANQSEALDRSWAGLTLLRYGGFFAAGVLAADVFVRAWGQRVDRPSLLGDAWVLAGFSLMTLSVVRPYIFAPLLPASILAMLLGSLRALWISKLLSMRPVYLIGGMCYTLYLYHFYVISAVGRWVLSWLTADRPLWLNLLTLIVCVVPAVLAAGTLLFVWIEKPFMGRRPEKLPGRMAPARGGAP